MNARRILAPLLVAAFALPASVSAAAAKKPPPDPKQKAEEERKKAEEARKKADDVKNWPARDYMNATALGGPVCVYIKDPRPKKNDRAAFLEGKEILGHEALRVKLRAFNRVRIKNDGSNGKGWPPAWTVPAEGGAVLVLFSGDLAKVYAFEGCRGKGQSKEKDLTTDAVLKNADDILRYDNERKAAADAKAKEEAAKAAAERTPELPGLDGAKKPPAKKKPDSKEPQDE